MTFTATFRPRRRRAWLTPVLWLALLGGMATAGVNAVRLYRPDAARARRLAESELPFFLERGEVVLARVPVQQRSWWDYYRQTLGVLAATDRRLLYVGVPPRPVLHPGEPGSPVEIVDASFSYVRGVMVSRASVPRRGLRITSGSERAFLGVRAADERDVRAVLDTLSGRLARLQAAAEAERAALDAASAAARRATYHLVQPGEALETIARRYGMEPDSIMRWNGLTSSRILAGQRLLVRRGQVQ